jgi:GNAT superfamily N-acetyltransferase
MLNIKNVMKKAETFRFSSLMYVDEEDIETAKLCIDTENSLFLYISLDTDKEIGTYIKSKNNFQVFWASNTKESYFEGLEQTINYIREKEAEAERIYIEFVPAEFVKDMESFGFSTVSEWVDHWNKDLSALNLQVNDNFKVRSFENIEDIAQISAVTKSCAGCSRGFTGQSEETIKEWSSMENSKLFIAEEDNHIVGICFGILYGFHSEKGTILWIRELAVEPKYQSRGIGRKLIYSAIIWGQESKAKRSFLACDAENHRALNLYKALNYESNGEPGQINMDYQL